MSDPRSSYCEHCGYGASCSGACLKKQTAEDMGDQGGYTREEADAVIALQEQLARAQAPILDLLRPHIPNLLAGKTVSLSPVEAEALKRATLRSFKILDATPTEAPAGVQGATPSGSGSAGSAPSPSVSALRAPIPGAEWRHEG